MISQFGKPRTLLFVQDSRLRGFDPRAKLVLSLCTSLMVMLPLERLAIFMLFYLLLLGWGKLLAPAASQVWRMKWILLVLFTVDWWLVGIDLALVITLRLVLLAGVFTMLFSTTTVTEFRLALESLRLQYRYAFSLSLAFQSLNLLDSEWRAILEAQHTRGALPEIHGLKSLLRQAGNLVSLTVPAIVLTTRRAWAVTEAAYARGFESPKRIPFRLLQMKIQDWIMILLSILVSLIFMWR